MRCKRCHNTDESYFYLGSNGYYCRKCIHFKRILLEEDLAPVDYELSTNAGEYSLDYELTPKQREISEQCRKLIHDSDVLLCCVCGAGKTNIVVDTISDYLKNGKHVCFAIPRKEVVLELRERFAKIFSNNKVIAVCGGHHKEIYGDLIICTTHQLYRYYKAFDLLIIDEVDAFPFRGDEVLNNIALSTAKSHIIYSTATIDDKLIEFISKRKYVTLNLYERPHFHPLIVPKVIYAPKLILILMILYEITNAKNQYIIFVESKLLCKLLYRLYREFVSISYVYSDLESRDENIQAFKNKKYQHIIATSVLERGITIDGVNVIILHVMPNVFTKSAIIQMVGRVGRSFAHPDGIAKIYSSFYDGEVNASIKEIKYANEVSLLR